MATTASTPTGFTALPRELRDIMYKLMTDGVVSIKVSAEGKISVPPLSGVSHQIDQEALAAWRENHFMGVDHIDAEVKDCNFQHLIEILQAYPSATRPTVKIHLHIADPKATYVPSLTRWFKFCARISKGRPRGSYEVTADREKLGRIAVLELRDTMRMFGQAPDGKWWSIEAYYMAEAAFVEGHVPKHLAPGGKTAEQNGQFPPTKNNKARAGSIGNSNGSRPANEKQSDQIGSVSDELNLTHHDTVPVGPINGSGGAEEVNESETE